jgi:hypothetical protein
MASTAVIDAKEIGRQIVKEENRLEAVKAEVEKNTKLRDSLQAEIDKKTQDYDLYISQRDAENKKMRSEVSAEREQMLKDKAEFQAILQAHKANKDALETEKRDFEIQKLKLASTTKNVQEFVSAVRRAVGLLGI